MRAPSCRTATSSFAFSPLDCAAKEASLRTYIWYEASSLGSSSALAESRQGWNCASLVAASAGDAAKGSHKRRSNTQAF